MCAYDENGNMRKTAGCRGVSLPYTVSFIRVLLFYKKYKEGEREKKGEEKKRKKRG